SSRRPSMRSSSTPGGRPCVRPCCMQLVCRRWTASRSACSVSRWALTCHWRWPRRPVGRVPAGALFSAGVRTKLHANARNLPPVLIVHGEKDKTVPVEEALELEKLLQEHKRTCEMKIYEEQAHLFKGDLFGADARDAGKRTLKFFGKYLQPPRA